MGKKEKKSAAAAAAAAEPDPEVTASTKKSKKDKKSKKNVEAEDQVAEPIPLAKKAKKSKETEVWRSHSAGSTLAPVLAAAPNEMKHSYTHFFPLKTPCGIPNSAILRDFLLLGYAMGRLV